MKVKKFQRLGSIYKNSLLFRAQVIRMKYTDKVLQI